MTGTQILQLRDLARERTAEARRLSRSLANRARREKRQAKAADWR
jgi:hypothetical protein